MKFLAKKFQICRLLCLKSADECIRWKGRIISAQLRTIITMRLGLKCVHRELRQLIMVIFPQTFEMYANYAARPKVLLQGFENEAKKIMSVL